MNSTIDRRTQIVDTAMGLFLHQGYNATGINKIIEKSGAPKGSLYYFFPNGKEEIALTCIERIKTDVSVTIEQALSTASFETGVVNFVRSTISFFQTCDFNSSTPACFWVSAEASQVSSRLRQACLDVYESWKAIYASHLLKIGVEEGAAKRLADIIVTLIEGALIQALVSRSVVSLENVIHYLRVILCQELNTSNLSMKC
jgi:TetR/AcrR family transcriptional repressor of lmrAB and yxaGH operons